MNAETIDLHKKWADEKAAKLKRIAEFEPLGKLLGFAWNKPNEECDWAFDLGDKEHGLFVRLDWHKKRLEISGRYPGDFLRSTFPYNESPPSISLSMAKSNEQIANDIKRRLLPAYEELLTRCRAVKARWDDYATKRAANEQRLIDAGAVRYSHTEKLDLPSAHFGDIYGDALVSDSTVQLNLRSLPIDLAEKILNFIRGSI